MAMGESGMAEHQDHSGHMPGPKNTLPMMMGRGPFGNLEMGGMFTVVKIRDDQATGDFSDPGWFKNPKGTVAYRVAGLPDLNRPLIIAPWTTAKWTTAPWTTAKWTIRRTEQSQWASQTQTQSVTEKIAESNLKSRVHPA